jgi:CBS domain-containing protein
MNIKEALDSLSSLPYLAVPSAATLEEAAERVTGLRQVRGIYGVDDQGRLIGTVSLGVLLRHLTTARHRPQFHVRSLLSRLTSEQVADLMDSHVIYATTEDDVEQVVDRMIAANIKEIPVVDQDRRLIGALGLLDLWNLLEK